MVQAKIWFAQWKNAYRSNVRRLDALVAPSLYQTSKQWCMFWKFCHAPAVWFESRDQSFTQTVSLPDVASYLPKHRQCYISTWWSSIENKLNLKVHQCFEASVVLLPFSLMVGAVRKTELTTKIQWYPLSSPRAIRSIQLLAQRCSCSSLFVACWQNCPENSKARISVHFLSDKNHGTVEGVSL